ncbi:MAG: hypothetical protein OHK93_002070 [Ramalina farinacea]|uniref:Aflatoxin regulatory protein domain-containing protein n=1 Tax=Ramalina farinacea TaxID=258253 RepID=A0AA43QV38_9LECA|nr:hypothetical protein [Ramalina farinacea]
MDFSYERQQDDMLRDNKAASPPSPPKTTSSEKGFFTSPSLIETTPIEQQMDICRTYSLPNLHEPCSDSLSDSPSLRCFADEVDSFFATLESLPGLDTSSRDMLNLPTHLDPMNSSANASANDPMIYDNMIPQTSGYEPAFTEDPCLDLLQLTPRWQTLPQASPTTTNNAATPASHTGPCSCLTTALGLIRDFGSSDSSSMAWSHQKHTGAPSMLDLHFPTTTLQSLISSNESILNTITQILSCPCSQDIYLLTMLSLVVFKVLDRYAAAATMTTEGNPDPHHYSNNTNNNTTNNNSKFRSNSSSNSSQASIRHTNSTPSLSPTSFSTSSSTTSSSIPHHHQHHHQSYQPPYPFTSVPPRPIPPTATTTTTTTTTTNDGTLLFLTSDTDPRRVSAQLVLGELHRAQRLVNELSTRFRSLGLTAGPAVATTTSSSSANPNTNTSAGGDEDVRMDGTGDGGAGTTSSSSSTPISTTMLEHLEKDLRARVRGVSKGVVEVIRRF